MAIRLNIYNFGFFTMMLGFIIFNYMSVLTTIDPGEATLTTFTSTWNTLANSENNQGYKGYERLYNETTDKNKLEEYEGVINSNLDGAGGVWDRFEGYVDIAQTFKMMGVIMTALIFSTVGFLIALPGFLAPIGWMGTLIAIVYYLTFSYTLLKMIFGVRVKN